MFKKLLLITTQFRFSLVEKLVTFFSVPWYALICAKLLVKSQHNRLKGIGGYLFYLFILTAFTIYNEIWLYQSACKEV